MENTGIRKGTLASLQDYMRDKEARQKEAANRNQLKFSGFEAPQNKPRKASKQAFSGVDWKRWAEDSEYAARVDGASKAMIKASKELAAIAPPEIKKAEVAASAFIENTSPMDPTHQSSIGMLLRNQLQPLTIGA